MRVLSIAVAHPLRLVNGATNAARSLSRATAELVDIDFAVMWNQDELVQHGPLVEQRFKCTNMLDFAGHLVPRSVKVPLYDSRISTLVSAKDYDIVHLHNLIPSFAAERLARRCEAAGVPYVVSTHGFNELSNFAKINHFGPLKSLVANWVITRPFHRIVKGAAAIFALSDQEHEMLNALGVADDRIHIVTNGVDDYYLQAPTDDERQHVMRKFSLSSKRKLLFMGSLHAYKGVDVYLASLEFTVMPVQAIVAGRFTDEEHKRGILARSGLGTDRAKAVVFTGEVTNAELRALYNVVDVFVYPTNGDTLPLVLLEAMACKLPVVSTPIGGIPFAVQSDTGILVPPNQPAAIASAVDELLADSRRCSLMGERGHQRVQSRFRWNSAAAAAVKAYANVLATRPAKMPST